MVFKKRKKPEDKFEPLTKVQPRDSASDAAFSQKFRQSGGDPTSRSGGREIGGEPPTRGVSWEEEKASAPSKPVSAEPKTRIFDGGSDADEDDSSDPPAGWLVITEGMGRGHSFQVGYGMNSIGRSDGQRIQLDFGDERISREAHAHIVYDSMSRRFYVSHGGGNNLTYLDGELVLGDKKAIFDRDVITIGDTKLMFVALCNETFDWQQP